MMLIPDALADRLRRRPRQERSFRDADQFGAVLAARDAEAEQQHPPGSLTPQAERQLRDSLVNGIDRHNAEKRAEDERPVIDDAQSAGEWPYRDIAASQVAAYRFAAASEGTGPRPEFHPAPAAAPVTAPMPVLAGNVKVPPPPPAPSAPAWVPATDREAMERTIGALQEFDFAAVDAAKEQEGMTYAGVLAAREQEAPAPDLSRAEQFVADMRFRGGLPLFRKTAHKVGWQGLNAEEPRQGWVRWSTAGWAARERELADAAYANAMTQALAGMELGDVRALINERLHAITGGAS